ncbi:MAG: HD domain-containing protein [Christensenellales bacterium]
MIPTRVEALALLFKYNETDALIKHAYAVEGVMRRFARNKGEDEEYWGIAGLLHDLDYEKYPDQHCTKSLELMAEAGIDEQLARSCASHGWGLCADIEPKTDMEKTLYTIDELTGLINAAALMRPSRSVMDMDVKSLKKKFKSKSFAAGVNREVVEKGAEMLGMPLDDVMQETLLGMQEVAEAIGLA